MSNSTSGVPSPEQRINRTCLRGRLDYQSMAIQNWNIQIKSLKLKIWNQIYEYKKKYYTNITKPAWEDGWTIRA